MNLHLRKLIFVMLTTAVLLPFNNCSYSGMQSQKDLSSSQSGKNHETSSAMAGGGTGYDGKQTYINLRSDKCPDGSRVQTQMTLTPQSVVSISRENCTDLRQPREVSREEAGIMPHNQDNALFSERAFDLLSEITDPSQASALETKFLCRGRYENKSTKQMQVADVIIKYAQGGSFAYSARVIMAVYNPDGALHERLDSGELVLRNISTEVEGRVKYVTPIVGRFSITIWIDKTGVEKRTGKLSFIDLPYAGREREDSYNYRNYERVIQNLECFTQ
jgi:hypothetical protein